MVSTARYLYKPSRESTPKLSDTGSSSPTAQLSPTAAKVSAFRIDDNLFKTPENLQRRAKPVVETRNPAKAQSNRGMGKMFEPQEMPVARAPALPKAHGITLVPVDRLPNRFRSVFSYPLFNAVQSRCFDSVYGSRENLVISSPTGSGKTAILELAICSLFKELDKGTYKIIYQAPTKSLCAERKRGMETF